MIYTLTFFVFGLSAYLYITMYYSVMYLPRAEFFILVFQKNSLLLFFYDHTCGIWKFPGQGLNPSHMLRPPRADPVRFLTHCATVGTPHTWFQSWLFEKQAVGWVKFGWCQLRFLRWSKITLRLSRRGSAVTNLTSIHQEECSIPGLALWVTLARELPYAAGAALKRKKEKKNSNLETRHENN